MLSAILFVSCTDRDNSPNIQDIVYQWTEIENLFSARSENIPEAEALTEASNNFILSLQQFQKSDLYRVYRAIPFSPQIERSFLIYSITDIPEVEIVLDLAIIFRDNVISGDMEKTRAVSVEISRYLIHLLIIDTEAQRYISSSYFQLLIAFIFFIAIIILLIRFLNQSLTRSLKREAEGTFFSHAYMLAQDEERARISRELHDTIIQDMRCLMLETEKISYSDDKPVPMIAELIRKTRDICNSLIPPDFRFSELPDALLRLCHDFGEKTGINCRAEIDGNIKLEFLSIEKRLQIFRIIQEALTNIEKHAQAKEAIVTMRSGEDGIIYIGIDDDGKGFKSPIDDNGQIISGIDKSHIGIISMKERAVILGGRLKIKSEIGEGALVCLEIPGEAE